MQTERVRALAHYNIRCIRELSAQRILAIAAMWSCMSHVLCSATAHAQLCAYRAAVLGALLRIRTFLRACQKWICVHSGDSMAVCVLCQASIEYSRQQSCDRNNNARTMCPCWAGARVYVRVFVMQNLPVCNECAPLFGALYTNATPSHYALSQWLSHRSWLCKCMLTVAILPVSF